MRLATTVLVIMALLAIPCSITSGVADLGLISNDPQTESPPQSLLQDAHPYQPGYIQWNKQYIVPGDTVYILPTNTQRDKNGYVPLHAFNNAVNGTYLYARSESFKPEFSHLEATIVYHGFKCSTAGALETQRVIPKQNVVFYNLPQHSKIPRSQIPADAAIGNASDGVSAQ